MKTRYWLVVVLAVGWSVNANSAVLKRYQNAWMYFDLGNTIIDTTKKDSDGKYTDVHYIEMKNFPSTREYLKDLKKKGFKLGMITNIPESWGKDYEEKLAALKKFVAGTWRKGDKPFNWDMFDEILLPPSDDKRKGKSPYLFIRALKNAFPCPLLYQGEGDDEIKQVRSMGLPAFQAGVDGPDHFINPYKVEKEMRKNFRYKYAKNFCLKNP